MHNPFKSFKKDSDIQSRIKQKVVRSNPPTASAKEESDSPAEDEVFLRAVSDVVPLHKGGRDIAVTRDPVRPTPPTALSFAQLLEQQIEFDLEYSREYIMAQVKGLDAKIFRKLKNGDYSLEAHLDLHGLNTDQAKVAVIDFLRRCYMESKRCVLLIPGRGKNSPQGHGVLRQELTAWLTQAPLKRVVLAFSTAQARHGGSGAVYLLLRQARKDKGKIAWEDIFTTLEDI